MTTTLETLRLLRRTGLLAWGLVALSLPPGGVGRPEAFTVWLAGFLTFGVLFAWATSVRGRRFAVPLLAAQSACVIIMTATQCRGWEGTLLVLTALQLGLTVPGRLGVLCIVLQTFALAWAIQNHWALRPALLLSPAYLGSQLLGFAVVEMLTRESRAREEITRTHAELLSTRELLAESARLNERLRIARELHDGMGHHLAALSLNLEALGPDAASLPLATARALTRRILDDVESVVTTLHHDRGVDLGAALTVLAASIPRPSVHVDVAQAVIPDPARAHTVLRCCQEIVTNSVKHAQARNVWIQVSVENGVVSLCARDDGAGTVRLGNGYGLSGMRERIEEAGGTFEIETSPGAGFRVRATLPSTTAAPSTTRST